MLDAYGKNAWLVGNAQLEDLLRAVERELVGVREEVEATNRERKRLQEDGRRALEGAEERWRSGVGGLVEVLVAGKELEEKVRRRLRGEE